MGQEYLLDSNVIIDYVGGKLPFSSMQKMNMVVNTGFNISPIVKIETLGFNGNMPDMNKLEALIDFANILYIDEAIIEKTIELRKAHKIKLGDAIIAATALVHSLDLMSRNLDDFKNIPGLTVTNPYFL